MSASILVKRNQLRDNPASNKICQAKFCHFEVILCQHITCIWLLTTSRWPQWKNMWAKINFLFNSITFCVVSLDIIRSNAVGRVNMCRLMGYHKFSNPFAVAYRHTHCTTLSQWDSRTMNHGRRKSMKYRRIFSAKVWQFIMQSRRDLRNGWLASLRH